MTEFVFVKPTPGGRVRMPDRNGTVMPVEGILVPRIDYYERLILSNDIAIVDQPKEAAADRPAAPAPPPAQNKRA